MISILTLLLLVPAAPELGLDSGVGGPPAAPDQADESEGPEPILFPGMPVERTSKLRSFHPLLSGLMELARPIREKLRDIELWNLRPDYRYGEFCISWEIEFSL